MISTLMTPIKSTYRSGELAAIAGVSSDTLRYYERRGVLPSPPRSQSGYRIYSAQALQRVAMIRSALSIGFSIDELAGILKDRDSANPPCQRVHKLAKEKLSEVETQLRELQAMRRNLRSLVRAWGQKLTQTPAGQPARLLESLRPVRGNALRLNLRRKITA